MQSFLAFLAFGVVGHSAVGPSLLTVIAPAADSPSPTTSDRSHRRSGGLFDGSASIGSCAVTWRDDSTPSVVLLSYAELTPGPQGEAAEECNRATCGLDGGGLDRKELLYIPSSPDWDCGRKMAPLTTSSLPPVAQAGIGVSPGAESALPPRG